jgi:hypothetical protein
MDMLCSDAREMTVQLRLLFSVTWFGTYWDMREHVIKEIK